MKIRITTGILTKTIEKLQSIGKLGREYMIFWLGIREGETIIIKEVYVPFQLTSRISIQIPEKGMSELFAHLRKNRYMLEAQVHIHPKQAFHSHADDFLAIVKHKGALSLVLPWFGLKTTPDTFLEDTACYMFTEDGRWEETNSKNHIEVKREWII